MSKLVVVEATELHRLIADAVRSAKLESSAPVWVDANTAPIKGRRFHKLCREGAFPAVRDGNKFRARLSDVEAFMASRPVRSAPPEQLKGADDPVARELAKGRLRMVPKKP